MNITGTTPPPSMNIFIFSPCTIVRDGTEEKKEWKDVVNGFLIMNGDVVRTDTIGAAIMHLIKGNNELIGTLVLFDKVEVTVGNITVPINKQFMMGLTFTFGTIDFSSDGQAVGLDIATGHCQVVTTGTAFRMKDDGTKTRVTVVTGKVRMTSKQDQSTRDLTAGETLAHSPGKSAPIWEP